MSDTEKDSQIRTGTGTGTGGYPTATPDLARARQAAGSLAATLVEPGMVVGLGTGDTAAYFIRALGERVRTGLSGLRCVATSQRSAALALSVGLQIIDLDSLELSALPALSSHRRPIDLTVDGADEIDPALQLIKGAGGALLFEKLVACASRELVIVADRDKLVRRIGERRRLPIEVVRFGARHTCARLRCVSGVLSAELRPAATKPGGELGALFVTDGGNYTVDIELSPTAAADLGQLHAELKVLPGVIETGLFLAKTSRALIGDTEGRVEVLAAGSPSPACP